MDYTALITSEHRQKPKFSAMVALLTGATQQITDAANQLVSDFDVDLAIGAQLDAVGRWVGVSRRQSIPIPGVFFTWDDPDLGWNFGSWKGPFESTQGVVELDDATYRAVIKAKIGANYWDGTVADLNEIGLTALASLDVQCFAIDNFDMSVTIYILGAPSAVVLELIKRGIVPPKPAGVRVAGYILASEAGAPFFALDVETTEAVAGLDFGSFGSPI